MLMATQQFCEDIKHLLPRGKDATLEYRLLLLLVLYAQTAVAAAGYYARC